MHKTKISRGEISIIFLICMVHSILLFFINNYTHKIQTYPDEIIYINMAKSLFDNTSLKLHGAPYDFSNLLYSLFLAPFFLIKDTIIRVQIILFANSVLMSLGIIPIYFISRELKISKNYRWLIILITCIWPDMLTSATFMSENLYFLLCNTAFYFCLKAFKTKKAIYAGAAGIITYFSYFCKEIGICILIAYTATEILFPLVINFHCNSKEKISTRLKEINITVIAVYCLSFGICYVLIKNTLLRGVQNLYVKSGALDLSVFFDSYKAAYLFYCVMYYCIAVCIAFLIIPLLFPLINYKKLSFATKKIFMFAFLLLLGSILVICMTISAKEDLGNETPRLHLRYLFPMIGLFFPAFFSAYSTIEKTKENISVINYVIGLLFSIAALLVFKGVYGGCPTEHIDLMFTSFIRDRFLPELRNSESGIIFYPGAVLAAIIMITFYFFFIKFLNKKKYDIVIYSFSIFSVLICMLNWELSYKNIHYNYSTDPNLVSEMDSINDYFIANKLQSANVMFIGDNPFSEDTKVYDSYFDAAKNEYTINYGRLLEIISSVEYDSYLNTTLLTESIYGIPYSTNSIEYFIVGDKIADIPNIFDGLELVNEIGGKEFFVYKNINPKTLNINN